MRILFQDLRYGVRMLLKKPGFTAIAVIMLALGIGANTAIFSVVYTVLLKSLPYENPNGIVMLWTDNPNLQLGFHEIPPSNAEIGEWKTKARSFARLSAFMPQNTDLANNGEPERIGGAAVTADFFPLLGVEPFAGRTFHSEEDQPGNHKVVVISFGLWQRRFGGDPQIISKTMIINGEPHAIIGVMPPNFHFPRGTEMPPIFQFATQADAWMPLAWKPEQWQSRSERLLVVLARLKTDVSLSQAQAEMDAITKQQTQAHPEARGWITKVTPLREQIIGPVRPVMVLLLCAVGLVLLIACVNVAALLVVRASARRQEIAIRAALGASFVRIVRQLLTESSLLAIAGSGLGLLFASWVLSVILALSPEDIPRLSETMIDGPTLVFMALVTALTVLLFGLAPAIMTSRVRLSNELKASSQRAGGDGIRQVQSWLVSGEIALAFVLLIGAGLLIRSLTRLQAVDPGFLSANVTSFDLRLPYSRYKTSDQRSLFFAQFLAKLGTSPGVEAVAAISSVPLAGAENVGFLAVEGRSYHVVTDQPVAERRVITPDYFKVMSIPVLQGRAFTDQDTVTAPLAVIVNETFVRKLFPNTDPIGKRLKLGGHNQDLPWRTVVAVIKDVLSISLVQEPKPQVYLPLTQFNRNEMSIVVKSALPPASLISAAKSELGSLDSALPIANIDTMEGIIAQALRRPRFNTFLISLFAGLALLLTVVGLYGSVAWAVNQRAHEIGIRMALGAQTRDVLKLIIVQGMKLVLIGVAIGLMGAFVLNRLMERLLFGVSATDPLTFALIALLLALVSLLACYVPARRAMKIDPIATLRSE